MSARSRGQTASELYHEFTSRPNSSSTVASANGSCGMHRCSRLEDTDGYLHKLSAYYETSRMTDMAEVKKQRWSALVQTRSKVRHDLANSHGDPQRCNRLASELHQIDQLNSKMNLRKVPTTHQSYTDRSEPEARPPTSNTLTDEGYEETSYDVTGHGSGNSYVTNEEPKTPRVKSARPTTSRTRKPTESEARTRKESNSNKVTIERKETIPE